LIRFIENSNGFPKNGSINVSVPHGRADIRMAQQRLNGNYIGAALGQV
jgi:hypothetical protein